MSTYQENEAFAKKYAGWQVEIKGNPRVECGRVVGYYTQAHSTQVIIVELASDIDYGFTFISSHLAVVGRETIKGRCLSITLSRLKPILPPSSTIPMGPDDCLDCGAIGIETCKPNCPNR